MKIEFKEEDITKDEIKKILDVYFDTKDKRYKEGMKEIMPFKWRPFMNKFHRWLYASSIKKELKNNGEAFEYRLSIVTQIDKSDEKLFYLKWYVDWTAKIFFQISRDSVKSKVSIYINKMISIEKWLWEKAMIELCKYYNSYDVSVEPSQYWFWFWKKMKMRHYWKINIRIFPLGTFWFNTTSW